MYKEQILIATSAALLVFLVFSYSLEFVAYDKRVYETQYEKNGVYERFGKENVNNITNQLFIYLQYEKEDKLIPTSFFNQKEKQHLLDVKNLLQKESIFCTWMTGLFLVLLILLFPAAWKSNHPYRRVLFCAGTVGLGGMILQGLFILISFSATFTTFHLVLFTNDLWLLNPATDNLIVLFPEAFWIAIAWRLVITMGIIYSGMVVGGLWLMVRSRKSGV